MNSYIFYRNLIILKIKTIKKNAEVTLTPLAFIEQTLKEIASCDASIKAINSEVDQAIVLLKSERADELLDLKSKQEKAYSALEDFATKNQDILFYDKKSLSAQNGTFGFRMGKPKFTLMPNFSWPAVTSMMKVLLPDYIRTTYEIAKNKLMEDRELSEVSKHFSTLGLNIVQEENFFVDLNKV